MSDAKPNSTIAEKRKLKMRDLTALTGLPSSTIHLYMRLGLLPAPVKTSRNQAWYDEQFVERLLLIRTLQTEAHMPLSAIRETLPPPSETGMARPPTDGFEDTARMIIRTLRTGPEDTVAKDMTRAQLIERGVDRADLDELVRLQLVAPTTVKGKQTYSPLDAQVALAYAKMHAYSPVADLQQRGGLAAVIAAFARYLKAMASAEAQEMARLLAGDTAALPPGAGPELVRTMLISADELLMAIHWRELFLAVTATLGDAEGEQGKV